ncbi:MAG: hypothetical protein ABJB05_10660, partial [Parafilimonas sp.]
MSDTTMINSITDAGKIKIFLPKKRVRKLLLMACFFISTYSFAQQPLQLDSAINIALKNSYDIEVARNNVEINSINNDYGVAGGLPVVTGSAATNQQLTNVNQKLNTGTHIQRRNAGSNNGSAGIAGTMLLYNGMRVVATKKRLDELEK